MKGKQVAVWFCFCISEWYSGNTSFPNSGISISTQKSVGCRVQGLKTLAKKCSYIQKQILRHHIITSGTEENAFCLTCDSAWLQLKWDRHKLLSGFFLSAFLSVCLPVCPPFPDLHQIALVNAPWFLSGQYHSSMSKLNNANVKSVTQCVPTHTSYTNVSTSRLTWLRKHVKVWQSDLSCDRDALRLGLNLHGATTRIPAAPSAAMRPVETSRCPHPWPWSPTSPVWTTHQRSRAQARKKTWRTLPTNPSWERFESFD